MKITRQMPNMKQLDRKRQHVWTTLNSWHGIEKNQLEIIFFILYTRHTKRQTRQEREREKRKKNSNKSTENAL